MLYALDRYCRGLGRVPKLRAREAASAHATKSKNHHQHTFHRGRMPSIAMLFLTISPHIAAAWGYCNDLNDSCANWAKSGQCEVGDHVLEMCPHSCAICPHTCRDVHTMCPAWADAGECKNNVKYMYKECPASCGVCKTRCYDKEPACSDWARKGECSKNKDLLTLCPVACGVCTDMCLDKRNDCPQWASAGTATYRLQGEQTHHCQVELLRPFFR